MMIRRSCPLSLKPSGKVMTFEVKSFNGILHETNDELRVDWLERHHIILRKVIMSYLSRHLKVALVDIFSRVNVIGL